MKRLCTILLIPVIIFGFTVSISAGDNSLWDDDFADLYEDVDKYKKGDIITVVIKEDANAIQSANTSTNQDSEIEAEAGFGIFEFLKAFGFGYSDSSSAEGQTYRSGTLKADITTQIVEVNDNGNLKIAGNKNIKINGEDQSIKLTGVIRPEDIDLDNTISSKKVAEADIEYRGKGVVAAKQRSSLFEKILNWIF